MSRLAVFLRENTEPILAEWETFARGLTVDPPLDIPTLRDHAKEMMSVIATDLDRPQSQRQQSDKARGLSDAADSRNQTAAQEHGAGRAEHGFTIDQMIAEFRALRASVIHLWMKRERQVTAEDLQDMTRFNEAIDQAIAESVETFSRDVRGSKDRFLAILGHDLRTPLGAIITSTRFMLDERALGEPDLTLVTGIERSARRMNKMVADLLEFTRTRFGDAMPVVPEDMDLEKVIRDVASEVEASYPNAKVDVVTSGDLHGRWDCQRIVQALTNLAGNAVQHGAPDQPIQIRGKATDKEVLLAVHNEGVPIPPENLRQLFDPMKDLGGKPARDRRHLGLGLYIVEKIAEAHGGAINVDSTSESGTTFTMRLPRHPPVTVSKAKGNGSRRD